jgi:diguanylate cyclase (GGDEF)-like protein
MPAEKAKREGKFGLAGRVALIACGAAVAATLAQWIITPLMAQNEVRYQRETATRAAAAVLAGGARQYFTGEMLGDRETLDSLSGPLGQGMPDGQALLYDAEWKLLSRGGDSAPLLSTEQLKGLAAQTQGSVAHWDGRYYALQPIEQDGQTLGYAVYSLRPRPFERFWFPIIWRNALVLVLALGVIAPFMLPLARKALKPVTQLENRIRQRDPKDKSKLADSSNDRVLKPLLVAVDEVHERSEAAMRRALTLAYADPVTRLPNRLRFLSKLEALVDKQGQGAYLAICDLDGFRKINASIGPRLADAVLAADADRLRGAASGVEGAGFFIGRLGADQFGILAAGADRSAISAFMNIAERAVQDPVMLEGHTLRVTAAFGAACTPEDAATATDLMKQAEVALKEAKHASGERRAFFDQRLIDKARARQNLEKEISEGLDRGEFVAVFQPKVKLETGELVGAEALARWRRPDGAVVSPGRFVPIAEEMGLIGKLGRVVMRDACFAAANWTRNGIAARIAVNVSPQQFDEPDFIQSVYQALDDSGLDPRQLELEITESAAVADPDRVARIMWPLRNRGVRLAIDDFGTGHSNFASITRLPFDVFKIDQQFVRALATDTNAPAIVEMILAMAEALGQETVAEGVETKEQADFLLRRACTIGQGYYYSPPLPAEEFDLFVRSWRPRPANKFAA